jgi:hypothetical protein
MKPFSTWCLGFLAGLTFFWVGMTSSGFDWARNWRLARASLEVEAIITRIEPHNHCVAHYEFEVNGERYQGKSPGGCAATIGDKIHVYYLPGEPAFSTPKTPGFDLVFVIFAPMILSAFAGLVVVAKMSRPRK